MPAGAHEHASVKLHLPAAATLVALAACSGGGGALGGNGAVPAAYVDSAMPSPGTYIKHVVVIFQENRSFDNVFAGFPGADSATFGYDSSGNKIPLQAVTFSSLNPSHDWASAYGDWNGGKMNHFNLSERINGNQPGGTYPYAYLSRSLVAPYWTMARQYALADRMFPTMFGGSFTAHLTLIAGTANVREQTSEVDYPSEAPWGCDASAGTLTSTVGLDRIVRPGSGPFPCFDQFRTIADTLDAARVSWRFYSPSVNDWTDGGEMWSTFDAIKRVRYGTDWRSNVIAPQTRVLQDVAQGRLAGVTWVIPDWLDSDHPGSYSNTGPSWVSAVVNAVGKSPFWKDTAIVVLWDDWGGWYDHVPPPQLDFRGLGIRVPCIIISPYVKPHYVSHTTYEFGSILRFVDQVFDLPPLGAIADGYTDTRATSLSDSFDFAQTPRAFTPIPAPYGPSYFRTRPPSHKIPDEE